MRYISLFSGIEAASVAWEPLGFEPVAFSEIDPFCTRLLDVRYPHVPNLGDISDIDWRSYHGNVNLIVGGSPCQAFSVAGPRTGLLDERSALMLEYVRAVREAKPAWCLWENVPGVLSQDRGRAFATLQRELENCGYSLAWRVLDAQFFGVAQRRRRVFLVGHADPQCAAAVLFERESLLGDYQSSKEARETFARAAHARPRETGGSVNDVLSLYENHWKDARVKGPLDTCPTVTAAYGMGGNNTPLIHCQTPSSVSYALAGNIVGRKPENGGNGSGFSEELCYTLTAMDNHAVCQVTPFLPQESFFASNGLDYIGSLCASDSKGVGSQYVNDGKVIAEFGVKGFAQNTRNELRYIGGDGEVSGALVAQPGMKQQTFLESSLGVRRLTPVECERLQGFPDNWTRIPWNGKPEEDCPDSRRYKALGNSMAVPVMRWIGQRIQLADRLIKEMKSAC